MEVERSGAVRRTLMNCVEQGELLDRSEEKVARPALARKMHGIRGHGDYEH